MTQRKLEQSRSFMFVPGNKQRFLEKTETLPLDVALFDLEDGVLPEEKAKAREMVIPVLEKTSWSGPRRFVRLNAQTTPWFEDDLKAVVRPGLEGVCMTKVNSVAELTAGIESITKREKEAGMAPGTVRVVAAIESPKGLLAAADIAAADPRVCALIFGGEDYALEIGLGANRVAEAAEMLHPRNVIIVAAAAAGVLSIDGVFPDLNNEEGCLKDIWQARRLGFTSKSTFNPRQVEMINEIFSPSPEDIDYARRLVAAFDEGKARGDASIAFGGQLVDLPILMRAERILEDAGER
jgi:citrate lyase subunit beta / citryl-CoA lyase